MSSGWKASQTEREALLEKEEELTTVTFPVDVLLIGKDNELRVRLGPSLQDSTPTPLEEVELRGSIKPGRSEEN